MGAQNCLILIVSIPFGIPFISKFTSRKVEAHATAPAYRLGIPNFSLASNTLTSNILTSMDLQGEKYIETRSTWRAQTPLAEADHYSHIAHCKMLSLSGERLTPKVLDHCLHHDLVMLPLLCC